MKWEKELGEKVKGTIIRKEIIAEIENFGKPAPTVVPTASPTPNLPSSQTTSPVKEGANKDEKTSENKSEDKK